MWGGSEESCRVAVGDVDETDLGSGTTPRPLRLLELHSRAKFRFKGEIRAVVRQQVERSSNVT